MFYIMKIMVGKFKKILFLILISLGVFLGCDGGRIEWNTENIKQQDSNIPHEENTKTEEDILGDIQIKLNSYKIGTHPDTSRPVLIVDYIVKNNGSESINFNKRYSTEATFKLSYFLEGIFKHRETVNLTEVSSKSSSSNDEEILVGETRLIKRYFVLPNMDVFYERDWGTYLNFTTTILDIHTGQSITKSFKL